MDIVIMLVFNVKYAISISMLLRVRMIVIY